MTVHTNNEEVEALANVLEAVGTDWESRTEQGLPTKPLADELADAALAHLAARRLPVSGDTSDGHHTFDELYDYRMLYNAHAAQGWLAAGIPVVKSWRHSDGELAFGGGWFVVSAQLPTGQVTNHYKTENWDLFDVPEVEQAPTWDGHTPPVAAERLRAALSASRPREAAPSDTATQGINLDAAQLLLDTWADEDDQRLFADVNWQLIRANYRALLDAARLRTSHPVRVEVSDDTCPVCQGVGGYWAERWEPCSACNGTGRQAAALGGGDQ